MIQAKNALIAATATWPIGIRPDPPHDLLGERDGARAPADGDEGVGRLA